MAITVNLGGVDVTAYVDIFSINLDESASGGFVGNCRLTLHDTAANLTIAVKAALSIVDGVVALFTGTVVDRRGTQDGLGILWEVTAQDLNVLLDEVTVESETIAPNQSDAAIIDDLFTTYLSTVDSSTYVETIDASMEALSYAAMTLREIMDDICTRTGGRYYVDYDSRLHYFTTESNDAVFALSTEPDMSTSYPYGGFELVDDGGRIINRVFVLGNGVSGWGQDDDSIAELGELSIPSRDMRITTAQGVTDRINAILAEYAAGRATYTLHTEQDGLRAGMRVNVINSVFGIDTWLYIRRLTLEFLSADGERRQYNLTLGAEPPDPVANRRSVEVRVGSVEEIINNIVPGAFDTTPPNTPALVSGNVTSGVDLADDGSQLVYLLVTWGAVGDSDLAYYDVQVSAAADFSGYTLTRPHPGDGDRVEKFFPLVGGTAYYVRVRAVDVSGNVGSWSDVVEHEAATDTSAPAQVAGLVVAGARTLIGLTWNANSEADLANYEVQRAPDSGGSPGEYATVATTKSTFYVDDTHSEADIAAAKVYWYRVRAIDSSGNAGDYSTAAGAALSQVGSDTLAAGCIITAKIGAGQVTADKITVATLSAISANLGTITAGTVTGATIRTAASGARCQMDSTNGYQAYNASGAQTFSVQTTGAGYIGASDKIAWNTAGSVSIDGSVLVAGTVVATAFSNVIGQPFFTAADGLLLLGPNAAITPTSWTSTRGQAATISGAFHQEAGAWTGTRGLAIEPGTVNYIKDPVFGNGTLGTFWQQSGLTTFERSTSKKAVGTHSLHCVADGLGDYARYLTNDIAAGNGQTWTLSFRIWVVSGSIRVRLYDNVGSTATTDVSAGAGWQYVTLTGTTAGAGVTNVYPYWAALGAAEWYLDSVQMEQRNYATSLAWGDAGTGYTWATPHASTTTRAATEVNLDDLRRLVHQRAAWSWRAVFRVQYAYNATWPSTVGRVWEARYDASNRIVLYYNTATTRWNLLVASGGTSATLGSADQTFAAGDTIEIVGTHDFSANSHVLYVNGVLAATDTTAMSAPSLTQWNLGTDYTGSANYGGVIAAEYGALGRVLTADEVAALYVRKAPLVDTGAADVPGIYLYDGKFAIASSTTGARIEITSTEIAGYNAGGTKQFYLRASDGVACAGAGAVRLDSTGLVIDSAESAENRCAWKNGEDTYAYIRTQHSESNHQLSISAGPVDGHDSEVSITAWAEDEGQDATMSVWASGTLGSGYLSMGYSTGPGEYHVKLYSNDVLWLESDTETIVDTPYVYIYNDLKISSSGGLFVGGTTNPASGDIWCTGLISTDGGTTKFELNGYSAGSPTATGWLTFYVNGATYRVLAQAM